TQVTINGTGFGASQGSGTVLLGTNPGTISSWTDTQIVATVATGSTTGIVQVGESYIGSNSIPFTVATATIANATPNSGAAGTQVTVSGSGFGSTQGSGTVWLGTAPAQVTSWSDTQIVATVVAGSGTGVAQVLQNGALSNSVPFTLSGGAPH